MLWNTRTCGYCAAMKPVNWSENPTSWSVSSFGPDGSISLFLTSASRRGSVQSTDVEAGLLQEFPVGIARLRRLVWLWTGHLGEA